MSISGNASANIGGTRFELHRMLFSRCVPVRGPPVMQTIKGDKTDARCDQSVVGA